VLVWLLQDGKERQRCGAARALARVGSDGKTAAPALVRALDDESWQARSAAMQALGNIGVAAAPVVPQMARCLSRQDDHMRITTEV